MLVCVHCGVGLDHDEVDLDSCPACGYDGDGSYWNESDEIGDGMTDVEADADALASAGWGTDEDYGDFGGDYL
jgi:Zn-finger nucleic acid-binding protein